MAGKVHILQNETNEILGVESSLKRLVQANQEEYQLLSYRHLHRLLKSAKDNGKSSFVFSGKDGSTYKISWWEL